MQLLDRQDLLGLRQMSLFDQYTDEADFRSRFVRPFLNKMGFYLVTELHGTREFGMDFVFSELHRFGGMKYYAAQVKHERAIRQGAALEGLYSQIKQAFAHTFTLPDSLGQKRVSSVYIFNTGDITANAKDDIVARMSRENYGENVFFMDGNRLQDLDRWTGYQEDRNLRSRLSGLKNQLSLNRTIWLATRDYAASGGTIEADIRGTLLLGIELFLTEPIFSDVIPGDEVMQLWQLAKIIDSIVSISLRAEHAWREAHLPLLRIKSEEAIAKSLLLDQSIDKALTRLKPL